MTNEIIGFDEFAGFKELCNSQDVGLNPKLLEPVEAATYFEPQTPSRLLLAISTACSLIRKNPSLELAKKTIEMRGNRQFRHAGVSSLTGVINTSVHRLTDHPHGIYEAGNAPINNCANAERSFARTFASLASLEPDPFEGSQVFVVGNDPLFLRKYDGANSAIALGDFVAGGILYRRLTLVGLETKEDQQLDQAWPGGVPSDGLAICNASSIRKVTPCRLTAFAYDPAPRSRIFGDLILGLEEEERHVMLSLKRHDPYKIVKNAMNNPNQRYPRG